MMLLYILDILDFFKLVTAKLNFVCYLICILETYFTIQEIMPCVHKSE